MNKSRIFKQIISKYQKIPQTQDGILGDGLGNVIVSGRLNYVWVRLENQGPVQIFNKRVAPIYDQPVLVGYDPLEPKIFQVLSVRTLVSSRGFGGNQGGLVTSPHHATHEWMQDNGGSDIVYSQLRQLMPLRPNVDQNSMLVYINRSAPIWFGDAWRRPSGQYVDMTNYVPATGARYNLLYVDKADAVVRVITGNIKDLMTLGSGDIPAPYPGTLPIAAIRTWAGQTGIIEARSWNDLNDLRWGSTPRGVIGCRVYRSTVQSVNDSTNTAMSYDTEEYDTDACWEGITNPTKLVARTAGYYLAGGTVSIAGADVVTGSYLSVSLASYLAADFVNISSWKAGEIIHCAAGLPVRVTVTSGMIYLNNGDAISVIVRHNSGAAKDIEAASSSLQYKNCAWLTRIN